MFILHIFTSECIFVDISRVDVEWHFARGKKKGLKQLGAKILPSGQTVI